jgi:hypothetical protein
VAHWWHGLIEEATMSTSPTPESAVPSADQVDLDALFRDAPVLRTPHDLAAPEIFPDDVEFDEFLASVRADRNRDLA